MKVPGRIEMGTIVGGDLHLLDRPALPIRQILGLQSLEELQHARHALLVIDVLDRGMSSRRIGRHVVLQRHRNIDQSSGHRRFLRFLLYSNQTGLMPALATMSRHFGTSSSMRFRMPSGPLARTSKPSLRNCSAMTGLLRISTDFLDNNSTIAGAVFAGARKPWNVSEMKSLSPSSTILGTSGRSNHRCAPVTANAFSAPDSMCGCAGGSAAKATCVVPLRIAWMAGPAPEKGTCVI